MDVKYLLSEYSKEELIFIGPTGSRLIGIEDSKDYDFLVILKERKNNQRILYDRSQAKHIELYTETVEEIKNTILGLSSRSLIGGIACLCAIPDSIYLTLDISLEVLAPSVIERIKKLIRQSPTLSKYIYYLPLLKHVLETNNHNYTDEEIQFAQKLYYKTELDEECREIFEYFNLEMY